MPYSAKSIANFMLELADQAGVAVTPMKLQKLVYYAHGWYAGYTDQPLIDETIEAWQYGPVIKSLYHEFKKFGGAPIKTRATELDFESFEIKTVPSPTDEMIRRFLTSVWSSYSKYTATALSEMTHAPGSPWDVTWRKGQGIKNLDIPQSEIVSHFKEVVARAKVQSQQAV